MAAAAPACARACAARLINKRLLGKYYVTSRLGVFFGVCSRRRRRRWWSAAFGHSRSSNGPLFTHHVKCDSCPVDRENLHRSQQFISFSPFCCFGAILLCSVNNCTLLFIFGGLSVSLVRCSHGCIRGNLKWNLACSLLHFGSLCSNRNLSAYAESVRRNVRSCIVFIPMGGGGTAFHLFDQAADAVMDNFI